MFNYSLNYYLFFVEFLMAFIDTIFIILNIKPLRNIKFFHKKVLQNIFPSLSLPPLTAK